MDWSIYRFLRDYHTLAVNFVIIGAIITAFVVICGAIRFCIAANRRAKGIYPPAASQMDE
jgi:hypothetical protein